MTYAHFRSHFSECKEKNSNVYKFGSFEGHALESILEISNQSMESIGENHNKSYNSPVPNPSFSSSQSNSIANSSSEEFTLPKNPIYLPKYNQTRKLRKQILNFVNDLEAQHDLSMADIMLNMLQVLTDVCDSEEVFGKFGYVKIENIKNYSSNLR